MNKRIIGVILAFCCGLALVSCASRSAPPQETKAESGSALESMLPPSDQPPVPGVSSFRTLILAEGQRVLPEDYYELAGEELTEFQSALMSDQWRDPGNWQGKGCLLYPCVIVQGEDHATLYINPANKDYTFDDTVIMIKYGKDQRYNAVYLAPGGVARQAAALRTKWSQQVTTDAHWFGQDDPTVSSHSSWEHLECRNWRLPQAYTEFQLHAEEIPESGINGELFGQWPERIFFDGCAIMWDGGFAHGPIKIGEIQAIGPNLSDPWGIDQADGTVYKLPVTETTVIGDEMALDRLKQTEKYQRYLTAAYAAESLPSMVRYMVKLEENHALSLFFFISPNLTS